MPKNKNQPNQTKQKAPLIFTTGEESVWDSLRCERRQNSVRVFIANLCARHLGIHLSNSCATVKHAMIIPPLNMVVPKYTQKLEMLEQKPRCSGPKSGGGVSK